MRELSEAMEKLRITIGVLLMWVYICKTLQVLHSEVSTLTKCAHFTVCKIYFIVEIS